MRASFLLAAFLLVPGGSAAAQDWPRWRGAFFDDASRETDVFGAPFELRVAWRRPVGSGYSGVSILDGVAVTQASSDGQDFVVALSAETGAVLWRHRLGPTFPGRDGANDGPVSTPTLHAGAAYALGPRGHLVALDLRTGEERWSTHLVDEHGAVQPHWGFTTAPLVVGENLVVQAGGPEGHAVTAFDAATGDARWSTGTDKIEYQSPILATVAGTEQVIACGERWLFGIDPEAGRELWRFEHQGSDFYRRIVNPLVIEDELLFLKNRRGESVLLSVGPATDGFPVQQLWGTRFIKGNYNLAVYHDGHVYGHNGSFLTCIETFAGERVWRSRPPGNGWVILVDGHLVVLTKAGTLHVAPASPEGYEELARLELFERLVWTPPSFAGGRIYARDSFSEVACVEVVPVERTTVAEAAASPGPGTLLTELEERLLGAADPASVVDAFLAGEERFPVIEGERIAHVFFRGEAEDLVLTTDAVPGGELPMRRLANTDLFAASLELEPDARVAYRFVRDLDDTLTDPRNPLVTETLGLGPASELRMPAYAEVELPEPERRGTLESFQIDSPLVRVGGMTWGGRRRIDVYLPPGYAEGDDSYPVIYVNDGATALEGLGFTGTIDRLTGRTIRPVIAVFVQSVSAYELARSQRDAYREMIVADVVPAVDGRYRTRAGSGSRAIVGQNEGGYGALFVALSHPEVFGAVGAQSVYLGSMQGEADLGRLVSEVEELPRVYLDWGLYDTRDGVRAIDTPRFSRSFVATLRESGGRVDGGEHSDGESFACWRSRLPSLLESLFPLDSR